MNAKEKAKILAANGYYYFSTGSAPQEPVKTRTYTWFKNRERVPNGSSTSFAQATNAAYEQYLESPVTDEPDGFMRPCEECNGSGAVGNAMGYLVPCSECDGTGIYTEAVQESTEELERDKQFYKDLAYTKEKRIAELEFELAEWQDLGVKLAHKAPIAAHTLGGVKTINILRAWLDLMSKPTEETTSFGIGDKVIVTAKEDEYENATGFIESIRPLGGYWVFLASHREALAFEHYELKPYTEDSEGKQS